ncbi:MAG: LysM peptidoglycan-binding domain-containing protein [Candidatus Omnitrophota bacterium]
MFKIFGKMIVVMMSVVLVTGCSSTRTAVQNESPDVMASKGLETRFYVEDRAREDQSMEGGNYGYIMGTPVPEDRNDIKKTRKVYVLEVTKNVKEAVNAPQVTLEPYVPPISESIPPVEKRRDDFERIRIPDISEVEPVEEGESDAQAYVVQEGDTLQKISKKFYGSYAKWTTIYDTNRDILKDPNRIKPGMRILIP